VLPAGPPRAMLSVGGLLALKAESSHERQYAAAPVLPAGRLWPVEVAPKQAGVELDAPPGPKAVGLGAAELAGVIRCRCCPMDQNVHHSPDPPAPVQARRYSDLPSSFSRRSIHLTPFIAFDRD
jgi:hypothetical protein